MMIDNIPFGVLGISHKTASVEIREQVAFSEEEQKLVLAGLKKEFRLDGILVLSTCNRTEIYMSAGTLREKIDAIRSWFDKFKVCSFFSDKELTYEYYDQASVKHFFKVISGMDSQIIGEVQITTQVKESYKTAHELGYTDTLINKLFNFGMQAEKKVQNETFLNDGTVSISFAGVELARKIFNQLNDSEVVLIGAGKTAELAAFHFKEGGIKNIHVVNRTLSKAEELASKFQGKAYGLENLNHALTKADIVISATSSENFVVTPDLISPISKLRHHQPIFLIDLAIPRDIDPQISEIDGVYLYNLDDLNGIVEKNLEKRKKEIPKATKIIEEFSKEFQDWMSVYSNTAVIGRLKIHLERLRLNEIDRLKKHLPQNGSSAGVHMLTESIINKLIRQHMKSLKKHSADPEMYQQHIDLIFNLYELDKE
jgi:glutamyl-tRNA reductase